MLPYTKCGDTIAQIQEIIVATLTMKQRKAMPQAEYALPGKRFPVNDRSHAANAKARATQGVKAGTLSPSQAKKVDAAANKVLKGKKK